MVIKFNLVIATIFCLLWGMFFLSLELLLFVGLLLAGMVLLSAFFRSGKIDIVGLLLLINFAYWITSGLLVGSIDLTSFFNLKFINGDGRIFIAWMPILVFSVVSVGYVEFQKTASTTLAIGVASVLLYSFWMVTGASQLAGAGHPDEYHGFLTSHSGSGVFFGTICVFLAIYGYEKRDRFCMLISLLCFVPVIASASREAIVGVMAVMLWYLAIRNLKPRLLILVATLTMLAVSVAPYISEKTWNRSAGVISVEFAVNMVEQAEITAHSDWQPGDWATDDASDDYLESGDSNVLSRIVLWTYAIKRFLDSPGLGIGWGRFNDRDVELITLTGIGVFALDGEPIFAAASAHNSYLHILAESGLLGLLLFLTVPTILYLRFNRAIRRLSSFKDVRAYYIGCQGLIVYAATCALTGHALASPSLMVPTATIIGVGMSFLRTNLREGSMASINGKLEAHVAQRVG